MERSNLKISLIAVLAVVMCAGLASAAPAGNGEGEGQREGQRERGDRGERGDRAERGEKGERKERGERPGRGAKLVFEGIDLTDEQKESVRETMQSKKAERDEIRAAMREARESGDQEAMLAVAERMQTLMDETHEAVRAQLTAEQQEVFDANLVKLKEKAEERKAKRGEGKNKAEGKKRGGDGDEDRPKRKRGGESEE